MEVVFTFIKGATEGLAYLHAHGIIHCDMAARNCLLDKDHTIKIGDFGLSKTGTIQSSYYRLLTKQERNDKAQKLPVPWLAPEIFEGERYSESSDVWSLGVFYWECFTRCRLPYGISNNKKKQVKTKKNSAFFTLTLS